MMVLKYHVQKLMHVAITITITTIIVNTGTTNSNIYFSTLFIFSNTRRCPNPSFSGPLDGTLSTPYCF